MFELGRVVIVVTLLMTHLFGGLQSYVNKNSIQVGDQIELILESDSDNTQFPALRDIGGFPIIASPTSRSMRSINGRTTTSHSIRYLFAPTKSMTIPSLSVHIDGVDVKTDEIAIEVTKRAQTKNQPFEFSIDIDNKNPYFNEPILLTASLKIANYLQLESLNEQIEMLDGFIVKPLDTQWLGERKNAEVVYRKKYMLFPAKVGAIAIANQPLTLGIVQSRGNSIFRQTKQLQAYSNPLNIEVKALPNGVNLLGDFSMNVKVDKTIVEAKKPVNIEIVIEGEGSLESFEPFTLHIPNATVFDDKPIFDSTLKNGKLFSKVTLKYAIIADKSYEIKAFTLSYLNPKNSHTKSVRSKNFKIKVKQTSVNRSSPKLISGAGNIDPHHVCPAVEKVQNESSYIKYLTLLFGVMLGVLLSQLFGGNKKEKRKIKHTTPLEERIKKVKLKSELLALLLPYIDQKDVEIFVRELESKELKKVNKKIKEEAISLFNKEEEI
jgi:hypothetical protein